MRFGYKNIVCVFALGAVVACAPTPAPVPPPPRPVIIAPPPPPIRPYPPGGAAPNLTMPKLGIDGVRETPNRLLNTNESIWHLRSALNVAAINCRDPNWAQITPDYNQFLTLHKVQLAKATKAIDAEYVKRYSGTAGLRIRDTKSTELYNYFALPPVKREFCDTSMAKVRELLLVPTTAFPDYAVGAIKDLDDIFIRFFNAYAKYEVDLADWNQRYAPQTVFAPAPAPITTTPVKPVPGT